MKTLRLAESDVAFLNKYVLTETNQIYFHKDISVEKEMVMLQGQEGPYFFYVPGNFGFFPSQEITDKFLRIVKSNREAMQERPTLRELIVSHIIVEMLFNSKVNGDQIEKSLGLLVDQEIPFSITKIFLTGGLVVRSKTESAESTFEALVRSMFPH